ncbi:MAG: helix-turn-helix domain-containing protein [Litorilinea sp.]
MTDEELIEAAAELLQRGDRRPFTMERLAAATGVSRATLYRRFGSRTGLMQKLTEAGVMTPETEAITDMPRRILHAARHVFARVGFAAATVEQIAQEASVGPATVYRYFGTKDGVIRAFTKANEPRRILLAMPKQPTGDVEMDLNEFAGAALRYFHENRDLVRLGFVEMGDGNQFLEQMRAAQERTAILLARYLHNRMEAGRLAVCDPAELALAFVGMIFSFAVAGPDFYSRPMGDPTHTAAAITRIFLHGNLPGNGAAPPRNGTNQEN